MDILDRFKNFMYDLKLFALNQDQEDEIEYGLHDGLTKEEVSLYLNPLMSPYQMREIRLGLVHLKEKFEKQMFDKEKADKLAYELVKLYATKKYTPEKMREIREAFELNIDPEKVKKYMINDIFEEGHLETIRKALSENLNERELDIIANKKFDANQTMMVYEGIKDIKNHLAKKGYSGDQLIEETLKLVNIFANPKFNFIQMSYIKKVILSDFDMEKIKFIANPNFDAGQMKEILKGLKEDKLSMDQIKIFADPDNPKKFDAFQMEYIRMAIKENMPKELIEFMIKTNLSFDRMGIVKEGLKAVYEKFTSKGISHDDAVNKTIQLVAFYAKPEFTMGEMYLLKTYIVNDLDTKKAELLITENHNEKTMSYIHNYIRKAQEIGLNDNQTKTFIKTFIKPIVEKDLAFKFSDELLKEAMTGLKEGLSINQIKVFLKPKYSNNLKKVKIIKEAYKKFHFTPEQMKTFINLSFDGKYLPFVQADVIKVNVEKKNNDKKEKNIILRNINEKNPNIKKVLDELIKDIKPEKIYLEKDGKQKILYDVNKKINRGYEMQI